jgi:hypothetical protein
VAAPRRARWLAAPRRAYLWAAFLLTPPIYSAISDIPALKRGFPDFPNFGLPFWLLFAAAGAAAGGALASAAATAARRGGARAAAAFLAPRAALLAWFAAGAWLFSRPDSGVEVHLHHLYLGWALAAFGRFNNRVSGLTLAVGAGIFVQGVASYSFAPAFSGGGCFETPAAAALECRFEAAGGGGAFSLRVCPAAGTAPRHACAARP